jgi:glycosyltransferase involved in cell wall biosynthesis
MPHLKREDVKRMLTVPEDGRSRLRICIATYGFGIGGGELSPIELANGLRARGHHVSFLAQHKSLFGDPPLLRHHLRNDIPVFYLEDIGRDVTAFFAEYGIQVLNSHNVAVDYALYLRRTPVMPAYIPTLRGSYETVPRILTKDFLSYLRKNVDEWLYLTDRNIEPLTSRGLSDATFKRVFNAPVLRPPNSAASPCVREMLRADENSILLVLASRAVGGKGWQHAIEITNAARESTGRDLRLVLIGDGPDFNWTREVNEPNDFVSLLGRLDNPHPIIEECDVGIFPSTYAGESFPRFSLECLHAGLPFVSTDIGEVPTILGELASGWIVPGNQGDALLVDGMVQVLTDLLRDEKSLLEAKALARKIAARYRLEELVKLYEDIFAGVVERDTKAAPEEVPFSAIQQNSLPAPRRLWDGHPAPKPPVFFFHRPPTKWWESERPPVPPIDLHYFADVELRPDHMPYQGSAPITDQRLYPRYVADFYKHKWLDRFHFPAVEAVRTIDEPVFCVTHFNMTTYGHFLLEVLPKIIVGTNLLRSGRVQAKIAFPANCDMLLPIVKTICSDEEILTYDDSREKLKVPLALIPSVGVTWDSHTLIIEEIERLADALDKTCGDKLPGPQLFLSRQRRGRSFRKLVNEAELWEIASEYGFELISPEILPWAEQVAMFRRSTHVIGEFTSALHGTMFSPPGTKVISLGWLSNDSQSFIGASFGHQIGYVLSGDRVTPPFDPRWTTPHEFSVLPDELRRCLESIFQQAGQNS